MPFPFRPVSSLTESASHGVRWEKLRGQITRPSPRAVAFGSDSLLFAERKQTTRKLKMKKCCHVIAWDNRVSAKFEFRYESLNSKFNLILFVYNLMIRCSKKNRVNYPRKYCWRKEKDTPLKFNRENNWALTARRDLACVASQDSC